MGDNHQITGEGIGCCFIKPQDAKSSKREEVEICKQWIRKWIDPRRTINRYGYNSYDLKCLVEGFHRFETGRGTYVSNEAFIQAAIELGYKHKPSYLGSVNAIFDMSFKRIGNLAVLILFSR